MDTTQTTEPVRARLINAARDCFLEDDYQQVTTRQIAERAGVNVAMISYYFGNKLGLYEEMIRENMTPLLDAMDGPMLSSVEGVTDFFRFYYSTMLEKPDFPKLILKVLALKSGPGRRFILQLLERGRSRGAQVVAHLKREGQIDEHLNADLLRLVMVSLSMTPLLLKEVFEEQMGEPMDAAFFDQLAQINGALFTHGLLRQQAE